MPKGHRPARSQGFYRVSPVEVATTPTTQYAPLSARPTSLASLSNPYYNAGTPTMSQSYNQPHQQATSGYPLNHGGPVQHPTMQQYAPPQNHPHPQIPHQPQQPQVSLRPSSGAWTPQDDQTLMAARAQGMNWAPIQQSYFPSKTPNACRKRHERLMERRSADDWDGLKLENMAKNYMQMRREIWAPLAAVTGEKWHVVEQKCLSHGLKNLQTSARSASRRERLLSPNTQTPSHSQSASQPYPQFEHGVHTDDSGYADDLEADIEYDADGASDRSGVSGGGSVYQSHEHAHSGHGYSQSSGSAGSMGMSGGMVDMRGLDPRYGVQQQGQGRLPSMSTDMGIDAIINRPAGGR